MGVKPALSKPKQMRKEEQDPVEHGNKQSKEARVIPLAPGAGGLVFRFLRLRKGLADQMRLIVDRQQAAVLLRLRREHRNGAIIIRF